MRRTVLLPCWCVVLYSACASAPGGDAPPPPRDTVAGAEATASASDQPPPSASTASLPEPEVHYEKPFRLTVKFPQLETVGIIKDTVWLLERSGESNQVEYVAYELSGSKFDELGVKVLDAYMSHVGGVVENGGTGVSEANVTGSKPQVLCADPKELRELKIDRATGEMKK